VAEHEFRVTVEDLRDGTRQSAELAAGDYVLWTFAPCYRASVQAYPKTGTHVITVKGHRPAAKPRQLPPDATAGHVLEVLATAVEAYLTRGPECDTETAWSLRRGMGDALNAAWDLLRPAGRQDGESRG
jgi:hypothetical protein